MTTFEICHLFIKKTYYLIGFLPSQRSYRGDVERSLVPDSAGFGGRQKQANILYLIELFLYFCQKEKWSIAFKWCYYQMFDR